MSEKISQPVEKICLADPEPIREHWVDVDGVRYPPKQAYQLLTGLARSAFTSHRAIAELRKVGFQTSSYVARMPNSNVPALDPHPVQTDKDPIAESFTTLLRFLADRKLTTHLADAEAALLGAQSEVSDEVVATFGFSEDLLDAALAVRAGVGRLNDVIHATVIARVLPAILEPEETVTKRPSLGAGNDPSRPFDLETDRRIAEFKVAQWKGADTTRKRGVCADLVHLALDESDRHKQLFVVGPLPFKFLTTSKSKVAWALGRSSPHTRARFAERFGTEIDYTIAEFTAGPAAQIEIVDLAKYIPSLNLPDQLL